MASIFQQLGEQLRAARKERGLSQAEVAARVNRSFSRVSELERDLLRGRWGRDRLTLFAEICDALDLVPMLVPRGRSEAAHRAIESGNAVSLIQRIAPNAFDDLFVDLTNDEDEPS